MSELRSFRPTARRSAIKSLSARQTKRKCGLRIADCGTGMRRIVTKPRKSPQSVSIGGVQFRDPQSAFRPSPSRPSPSAGDPKPVFLLEFSHLAPRQSKCRLMRILTPIFSVLLFASVQAVAQGMPILNFNMTRADGTQVVYEFRVPDNVVFSSFADTAEAQHQAGVTALTWAQGFYSAHDVFLQS